MLRTESQFSAKAASAFNHWTISPTPAVWFYSWIMCEHIIFLCTYLSADWHLDYIHYFWYSNKYIFSFLFWYCNIIHHFPSHFIPSNRPIYSTLLSFKSLAYFSLLFVATGAYVYVYIIPNTWYNLHVTCLNTKF